MHECYFQKKRNIILKSSKLEEIILLRLFLCASCISLRQNCLKNVIKSGGLGKKDKKEGG